MEFNDNIIYGLISIVISIVIFFSIRGMIKTKLKKLKGTQKMLKLISLGIVITEVTYLGINFGIFQHATEVIASVGVAFALVVWAIQNNLKNMVAGIGIYLNSEIDIGDIIEVEGNKGVIIELHLTKITALDDDGVKMFIPTQKYHEEVVKIYHKQKKSK
ncbi:MAG: mechanosensitive ion channel [Nitrosopumilus sp.]|nr:mechanosensitive ion channel family protein [Nitrosopumilus sp.]NNL36852.1 mechanosensitive ion channel [Nitrosopumilus sp.]NNM36051.1 mechanosensitive ion channel [Nitrosopumilus sp.]